MNATKVNDARKLVEDIFRKMDEGTVKDEGVVKKEETSEERNISLAEVMKHVGIDIDTLTADEVISALKSLSDTNPLFLLETCVPLITSRLLGRIDLADIIKIGTYVKHISQTFIYAFVKLTKTESMDNISFADGSEPEGWYSSKTEEKVHIILCQFCATVIGVIRGMAGNQYADDLIKEMTRLASASNGMIFDYVTQERQKNGF